MAAALRLSALLSALLLAACWTGKPFYSGDDLRAPIASGVYRAIEKGSSEEHGRYRISVRPDGHTVAARLDGTESETAGFAPLPGRPGTFVAWLVRDEDEQVAYGLLERRGSEYVLSFPMCSDTRSIAEAAGGVFKADPKVPMCVFPDRARLEAGLRRAAGAGPLESLRLSPVGKESRD